MKDKIPKIKKKVNAFLVGEEGKISKESLMKIGLSLSAFAVGTAMSAKKAYAGHSSHAQNVAKLSATPGGGARGWHENFNHSSHSSHASHSSHGSHGQW